MWENEVWTDYCSERCIKLLFQGAGAHPWLLERRNGLARGIYNRLVEDDRFSSEEILGEVQWRLNAMLSTSGFSAYQMVFGSNPADLFGWDDSEEDLSFAQDTSLAGQFVNQWKLRMRAQEATLKLPTASYVEFWLITKHLIVRKWPWVTRYCFIKLPIGRARRVGGGQRKFWASMKQVSLSIFRVRDSRWRGSVFIVV